MLAASQAGRGHWPTGSFHVADRRGGHRTVSSPSAFSGPNRSRLSHTFNSLTISSGAIWRPLTGASRQTMRTPLQSADWSLSAAQTDFAGLDWGRRLNTNCLYFRVRSRTAGDGDWDGAVGCRLLRHRTGHWPSDHMIRSQSLIGWPPKIVSKVLEETSFKISEENRFKDFGGNLFQRFWRKLVSKIFKEICFKDFGGSWFQRFWRNFV